VGLAGKIEDRTAEVGVVGLGYVGVPLALAAAEAGFLVRGIDVDAEKVEELLGGKSQDLHVDPTKLAEAIEKGTFVPTTDHSVLREASVILVCVPTPLKDGSPDMSFVEKAAKEIGTILSPQTLVILESTSYPGTTDELLRGILEETSSLTAGTDFWLGFSPERIDPGLKGASVTDVPKIVGGIDSASTDLMTAFYGTFVQTVVPVSSPKAAEMTKLLENTYRHVNIALANEIGMVCRDLGIDVWEVIEAAATKPFGFQPFYPGPGWGGHCIPVDPAYLSWSVRRSGKTARFVELAREINLAMPAYVVEQIAECLNGQGQSVQGTTIIVLGVAYKADVADERGAPSLEIISRLIKSGATAIFHDPYIEKLTISGEVIERTGLDEGLDKASLTVIVTDHSDYDWEQIVSKSKMVLDTRNATKGLKGNIVRL
jgi:UDP-N-acetyl-D-glucosamine dehydrogenase